MKIVIPLNFIRPGYIIFETKKKNYNWMKSERGTGGTWLNFKELKTVQFDFEELFASLNIYL